MESDIFYPEGLPAPLKASNAYTPVSPLLRTPMESGRARQRRKFSSVPTMNNVEWYMNDTQAAAFELWFKENLKDGTEWFNMRRASPLGFTYLLCRFTDIYDGPSRIGVNRWRYSATLEMWERPIVPSDWALLPDYLIHADIFDLAMNREWPEA